MTFGILLTSTVVGTAEAMLAEYLAESRKAVASKEIGTFQAQQIKLGEATAALNAVQAQIRAEALKFKRSPLPTSSRTTLRGRNIAATLHMRAGSHIGQPSGFLIWQALAPLMPAAKSANHCSNAARSATRLHQYRRAQARSHQPPANKPLALVNRFVPALTVVADDDAHFDWRRLFAASCGVGRWPIAV